MPPFFSGSKKVVGIRTLELLAFRPGHPALQQADNDSLATSESHCPQNAPSDMNHAHEKLDMAMTDIDTDMGYFESITLGVIGLPPNRLSKLLRIVKGNTLSTVRFCA